MEKKTLKKKVKECRETVNAFAVNAAYCRCEASLCKTIYGYDGYVGKYYSDVRGY